MSFSRSDLRTAIATADGFADNAAHLRAEIDWVRRLIAGDVRAAGPQGSSGIDEFAGLCITRDEVERYLDEEAPADPVPGCWPRQLAAEVAATRAAIDGRVHEATAEGVDLRLARLARAFELDDRERAALLCVAACELDPRIARVFAYLQNDATKKRPTCGQVARIVAPLARDSVRLWQLFSASSPLLAERLIDVSGETADTPLPARELRLATGLGEFLLGIDALPPPLAGCARLVATPGQLDGVEYHRHHRAVVEELLDRRRCDGRLAPIYVSGPAGAGQHLIASALAARLGKTLLRVQWPELRAAGGLHDSARLAVREARLRDALVLLEDADDGLDEGEGDRPKAGGLDAFLNAAAEAEIVATGTTNPSEFRHRARVRVASVELPFPTAGERSEIWRRHLSAASGDQGHDVLADVPLLAQKFKFTPEQIERAFRSAETSATRDEAGLPRLTSAGLHARCRDEAQRGLHRFCHHITPRFDWDDIVLAPDTRAQLQEICEWVRHRSCVYEHWGFGEKLAPGGGVTVLLSGASGTGKTMSAEIIAADLQLDLFRVDLSRIVSKYIGETERNLSRIFQSGISNCVLFFDEADALFGKRTEVKDAHDRYANIEVNYLLSEMERSEGVIIVATNLKGNLDPAFIRRFSHVVEYPVPGERLREAIWAKVFPEHVSRDSDLDLGFLAQRFNLAGGHIRNIALSSAFMAAAGGVAIGMEHVIRATKREYQKIGRVCSKSDFGEYYNLVREVDPS